MQQLKEQKESYEKALKAIAFNARSFHKGEDGKERALDVIGSWAENPDLVPEGVGYPASEPDFYTEERRKLEGTHGP